ncbi:MAG: uroporphyrinogen-III synthase [Ignavibacteria bacterium]|nr:uroporphyrinogen-III synthase [Ignavibacteria bacterium]
MIDESGFIMEFEQVKSPLAGKRIVITREAEQGAASIQALLDTGAEVISFPTVKFVPIPFPDVITQNLQRKFYDFIIFPSQNAVTMFLKQIPEELHILHQYAKIVAIGEKTALHLSELGISVHFTPSKYNAETLVDELRSMMAGCHILLPSSDIAREDLSIGLGQTGAHINKLIVYATQIPDRRTMLHEIGLVNNTRIDCFIFTSPSTFNNFLTIVQPVNVVNFFNRSVVAVIGPVTGSAVRAAGVQNLVLPEKSTMESLLEAIIEYYEDQN